MREIKWCCECHFGIYPSSDVIEFHDKTYHLECLLRVAVKLNIQDELVKMGLDQPPTSSEYEGG